MSERVNTAEHQPGTQKAYQAQGMEYYLYIPPGESLPEGWLSLAN